MANFRTGQLHCGLSDQTFEQPHWIRIGNASLRVTFYLILLHFLCIVRCVKQLIISIYHCNKHEYNDRFSYKHEADVRFCRTNQTRVSERVIVKNTAAQSSEMSPRGDIDRLINISSIYAQSILDAVTPCPCASRHRTKCSLCLHVYIHDSDCSIYRTRSVCMCVSVCPDFVHMTTAMSNFELPSDTVKCRTLKFELTFVSTLVKV